MLHSIRLAVPPDVDMSAPCMDLLARLLTADPRRRATMDTIMGHPWFREGLPAEALSMNQECVPRQAATLACSLRAQVLRSLVESG